MSQRIGKQIRPFGKNLHQYVLQNVYLLLGKQDESSKNKRKECYTMLMLSTSTFQNQSQSHCRLTFKLGRNVNLRFHFCSVRPNHDVWISHASDSHIFSSWEPLNYTSDGAGDIPYSINSHGWLQSMSKKRIFDLIINNTTQFNLGGFCFLSQRSLYISQLSHKTSSELNLNILLGVKSYSVVNGGMRGGRKFLNQSYF